MIAIEIYIILAISFMIILFQDAYHDYRLIIQNRNIHHFAHSAVVGVIYICVLVAAMLLGLSLSEVLAFAALIPAVRWIFHDLLLNWFRKLPWDYLGEGSLLDRVLTYIHENLYLHPIVVKILFLGVSILIAENVYALTK